MLSLEDDHPNSIQDGIHCPICEGLIQFTWCDHEMPAEIHYSDKFGPYTGEI
jgi:phage FluMu protein Com